MRILGIDPGLQRTGFGVLDVLQTGLHYIASGTISTQKCEKNHLPQRLGVLHTNICEICDQYQPDCVAVEIVFVNVNPQASLLLGQARGACITGVVSRLLPVYEYTALQVKQAVTGYGKADKVQVQSMVVRLLHLTGTPKKDAADALAVAITHAHAYQATTRICKTLNLT